MTMAHATKATNRDIHGNTSQLNVNFKILRDTTRVDSISDRFIERHKDH